MKARALPLLLAALALGIVLGGSQAFAAAPPTLEVQTIGLGTVTATGITCGNSHLGCATAYGSSVDVTLKATAASGWTFVQWDDDASGCGNPCTISAWSGDKFATAVFSTTRSVQLATLTTSVTEDTGSVAEGTVTDPSSDSPIACPGTCSTQVVAGSTLTIQEAPASSSYFFSQWAGSCAGTHEWCSAYLPANGAVTANFVTAGTSTLEVTVDGGGTVTGGGLNCGPGSTCSVQEPTNGKFTLTASANPGYAFDGWSGDDCAGDQATCTVDMSQDRSATATFVKVVPLLLTVNGAGTVSGPDISCGPGPSTCSGTVAPGSTIQFQASPTAVNGTVSWLGCTSAAGTICNVVVGTSPISVTATFSGGTTGGGGGGSFVTLAVTVTGDGLVTATTGQAIYCTAAGGAECTASIQQNSSVSLHAVAASGAFFNGWGGVCAGTASSCTVTMATAKSVTASFSGDDTTDDLTVAISGSGSVTGAGLNCKITGSTGCTSPQADGASVVINATPAAGSAFAGWSGDCTGSTSSCTLTMSSDRNVTATFKAVAPQTSKLAITVAGVGTVAAGTASCVNKSATKPTACTETVKSGTTVQLNAAPVKGYVFVGWKGACTGTKTPCTITVAADAAVTATFRLAIGPGTKKPTVLHLSTGFRITISFRAGEAGTLTVTTKPKSVTIKKTVKAGAGTARVTVKKHGRYVVMLSLRSKSGTHTLHYAVKV